MHVLDSFSLKSKVAVVTGGAGLYGRQIAEALGQAGAKVFMASRNQEKLQAQANQFRQANLDVTALPLDQGDAESIKQLLETITQQAGGVDILVNNAVLRCGSDWDSPDLYDGFAKSMHVNVTGILMTTHTFGNHMAQRGSGSIINIGSIYGMVAPDYTLYEGLGWPTSPDYYVHKGAMLQLTRFAAAKLGPCGVRVNCISPGGFANNQPEVFVDRYNARTMLGRMANETDLKGVIVFLASDASSYITATNIPIDAGLTAK